MPGEGSWPKTQDVIRSKKLDISMRSLNAIPEAIVAPLHGADIIHADLSENRLTEITHK